MPEGNINLYEVVAFARKLSKEEQEEILKKVGLEASADTNPFPYIINHIALAYEEQKKKGGKFERFQTAKTKAGERS